LLISRRPGAAVAGGDGRYGRAPIRRAGRQHWVVSHGGRAGSAGIPDLGRRFLPADADSGSRAGCPAAKCHGRRGTRTRGRDTKLKDPAPAMRSLAHRLRRVTLAVLFLAPLGLLLVTLAAFSQDPHAKEP